VRLTISERMSLLDLLPLQGNVVTLRMVMSLREKVALTEEEIDKWQVKQIRNEGGGVLVQWAPKFDKTRVDIPMSDHEKGVVTREIMQRESKGQLTINALPLYDYFVDKKEPEETSSQTNLSPFFKVSRKKIDRGGEEDKREIPVQRGIRASSKRR